MVYNLIDHLMVDLKIRIAIASMTYILDLDAYELDLEDDKICINLIREC